MKICWVFSLLAFVSVFANARHITKEQIRAKQREAAKRWGISESNSFLKERASSPGVKNITFKNPKARGESFPYDPNDCLM